MAAALKTGDTAPDFTLPDQHGEPLTLSTLLADGPVVLFFYPVASSSGCTQEACHFRDLGEDFAAAGARRVGISTDAVSAQAAFDGTNGFGFPLVSDADGDVARAYGVKRNWLGKLAPVKRVTFVIGADGRIVDVIGSETKMAAHADGALAALRRPAA